uniref:Uncharacterized protein n=1 Tax=Aegilops tauschii subsp. strangulata TaxID=200361 RepID=A0A453IDU6_AEGTS
FNLAFLSYELKGKALISQAKVSVGYFFFLPFSSSKNEEDHAFLLELLFWFKQSFRLLKYSDASFLRSLLMMSVVCLIRFHESNYQ